MKLSFRAGTSALIKHALFGSAFLIGVLPVSSAYAETAVLATQTASSTGGSYASGDSGYVTFPDGSTRWFTAMFVNPTGTVVGSPATGTADLRKSWAVINEEAWGADDSGGGLAGPQVCHQFVNPDRWSPGKAGAMAMWPASGPQPTWTGMQFDVRCDDGAGYLFYRVTWANAVIGGDAMFIHTPAAGSESDVQSWGWSLPYAANGALVALRRGAEPATMTVCGFRAQGAPDCYGNAEGGSVVVPSAGALFTGAYQVLG